MPQSASPAVMGTVLVRSMKREFVMFVEDLQAGNRFDGLFLDQKPRFR